MKEQEELSQVHKLIKMYMIGINIAESSTKKNIKIQILPFLFSFLLLSPYFLIKFTCY